MSSVKTKTTGHDAMTALSALRMAEEAKVKEGSKKSCDAVHFAASAVEPGEQGEGDAGGAGAGDQALPPRRPEELTQFRFSQLEIGKPAPAFRGTAVVDGEFVEIALEDFRGKFLVFFFYPADFTFVCPTELVAFSDRIKEFQDINCAVVACSCDSHFCHLAWTNTPRKKGGLGAMRIPILSDKTMDIGRRWGVIKEDEGIAFRGLFIVDASGRLRQVTINDLPVGRSVDETLRLVQAIQFTDEHGEVCPINWKPGDDTIVPTPQASAKFFEEKM